MSQRTDQKYTTTTVPTPLGERPIVDVQRATVREVDSTTTAVDRKAWSPAQFVAAAVGLFLAVLGSVSLLRSGFETLTSPEATVMGFTQTPLMAIISIALGIMFVVAAASAFGGGVSLVLLGLAALGFGLVIVIEPGRAATWLGEGTQLGVLYIVIGAVSLLAGWASPTIKSARVSTTSGTDSHRV